MAFTVEMKPSRNHVFHGSLRESDILGQDDVGLIEATDKVPEIRLCGKGIVKRDGCVDKRAVEANILDFRPLEYGFIPLQSAV